MQLFGFMFKFGLAAILGFLVGLVAVYVIAPVTENGRLLLLFAAMCATILVVQLVVWLIGFFRGRNASANERSDKG